MKINEPPVCNTVDVNPKEGNSLKTEFTMSISGC